jgi:hypothetical protein
MMPPNKMPMMQPPPNMNTPAAPQPMGAHAMLGERLGGDMYSNPVLESEPFDESIFGDLVRPSAPMEAGLPQEGMDALEQPDVRREMIDFMREKAKARMAASQKFQASTQDTRNQKQG